MPKKGKKGGSTKLLFDSSSSNIFDKLFGEDTPDSRLLDCDIELPELQKTQFICSICQDVLSLKSVSTGCHHFCSICISKVFTTRCENSIPCPICYKDVCIENITAVDEAFKNILNHLTVVCNLCKHEGSLNLIGVHDCHQHDVERSPHTKSFLSPESYFPKTPCSSV